LKLSLVTCPIALYHAVSPAGEVRFHLKQVALGRLVLSQRERLVALEPRPKGIVATTLRSYDEVRDMADAAQERKEVSRGA
jgi:non-homologous end joining protein Ku